ncbi:MAG: tRNA glutamyl-Q(34) synthetase GluQRS [Acidobacteriota bacterium]
MQAWNRLSISSPYIGRFAPSPTGPLHFGSLVAALGSWLDARAAGGQWLVRMEDVDEPRCVPRAETAILRALEAFHLHWDGEVLVQSQRKEAYAAALDLLKREGHVFGCACSRKDIEGDRYPGTCRNGTSGRPARSWRIRVPAEPVVFHDRRLGDFEERLEETCGDVVLLRADGYFAYQLAVVVDDAAQGVTDVVRGADLLDSTARQIALHRALGNTPPRHLHMPVVVNAAGQKLSKQTKAAAIESTQAEALTYEALAFLGLNVDSANVAAMLAQATARWRVDS